MTPLGETGDWPPEVFREAGHRAVDWVADYLARIETLPVLARVQPGEILRSLPTSPPENGEPFENLLADLDGLVLPGITH